MFLSIIGLIVTAVAVVLLGCLLLWLLSKAVVRFRLRSEEVEKIEKERQAGSDERYHALRELDESSGGIGIGE